jgi:protein-serine/threonine kinase
MAYRPPPQQQGQQVPGKVQGGQQIYGQGQTPQFQQSLAAHQAQVEQANAQRLQQQYNYQQQQYQSHQQHQQAQQPQQQQPQAPPPIPTEYVYFERQPNFRKDTLEKAQAAKLKLEHFYQKAVQEAIERNTR